MKKITYLILSVLTAILGACSEDVGDYTIHGEALSSFDAQTPVSYYALMVNKSTPEATLAFQWKASASGLGNVVTYKIEFDQITGDFSKPLFSQSSADEGKAATVALSYSQLQEIATKVTPKEGVYEVAWRVEATNSSGVKKHTLPLILKISIPETGITAIQLISPENDNLIDLNKITRPGEKLTFKWSKSTASDGSVVKYQLLADEAGKNFEKPVIVSEPTSLDSIDYTTTELVELFRTAGYNTIDMILEWKVVAMTGDVRFSSEIRQAAFSIQDIPVLYIVGNATLADWSPENGVELTKEADGIYSVVTKLFAGADKGWKFIAGKSWGEPDWGTEAGADPMGGKLLDGEGESNIPAPAEDGSYKITVDFNTMTYKVEAGSPEKMYIIGNVLGTREWDNANTDYILFKDNNDAAEKVYTYTGYFRAGEFKFISEKDLGTWNNLYGKGSEGVLSQAGGNIDDITVAGYYTVTVDFTSMTYIITPYSVDDKAEYNVISLTGSAVGGWGTDFDRDLAKAGYDSHIWTITTTLAADEVKLRAEHDWAVAWGEGEPEFGLSNGAPGCGNFRIRSAGEYEVKFNDLTGHYIFIKK